MNITRFINLSSVVRGKVSIFIWKRLCRFIKSIYPKVFYQSNNGLRTCCSAEKYVMKQNELTNLHKRHASTCEVKGIQKEESLLKKALDKIPFLNLKKLVSIKCYVHVITITINILEGDSNCIFFI